MKTTTTLTIAFLMAAGLVSADESWTQFRGPGGQGHAQAKNLPLAWSETENVVWKTAVPGRGWSSPVISGDRIWMTTAVAKPASEEEREKKVAGRPDAKMLAVWSRVKLKAVCVSRDSGKLLRDIDLLDISDPEPIHSLNSFASPTPILEGDKLYCHFGANGTVCLNVSTGEIEWKNVGLKVDHQNGPGASPVLWRELLILHCDGIDKQYVAALDKRTGKIRWKTKRTGEMHERVQFRKAYSTPLLVEDGGRTQLISPAANWVYSYDPATGRELWRAAYGKLGFSNVARPVVGHGMVFICSCFMQSSLYAVRFDGEGDVTDSHIVWRFDRQVPRMPSPILVGDEIYFVSDNGVATCLDAKTGKKIWVRRLGGNFSASPLYAAGRIYFFNREGEAFVFSPGADFELLAKNELEGRFMASPAIVDDAIFLRTDSHLYRIEKLAD